MKSCPLRHLAGFHLITALIGIAPAPAATVNVCDDASLRAAVAAGGTVNFGCDGTITLTNTLTIAGNTSIDGTGHNVTLSGGNAVRVFSVNSGVQFTLKQVTVANGFGAPHAGALWNNGSTHLIDCTFTNHLSLGAPSFGGAIFQGSGSLGIAGCTFVGNQALGTNSFSSFGGAIGGGYFGQAGAVNITNSTFCRNSASSGGALFVTCNGGANGPVYILNSTFFSNTNGGISYCSGFGPNRMVIQNTLYAYNNGPNCAGVIDGGHNLSSDGSGGFTHPFSLENIEPLLGPLANNGGSTLTLALLPGSPAIDAGGTTNCPATDQRGVTRPSGSFCDIGAVEANAAGPHPGVFQLAVLSSFVTESNRVLTITVVRAGGSARNASVDFATSNRTAIAGADFGATNGTLVFLANQRTNTFELRLFDDSTVEDIESLDLVLSNPTGGAGLGRAVAAVDIHDDDISLAFPSASYSVSESAGTATMTVLRAGNTSTVVSVTYTPADGTATGSDYQSGSGVVNFSPGQTSATFVIAIANDPLVETDEVFNVSLSNPTAGAVLANPSTTAVTIFDDDGVRVVSNCDESSLRLALNVGGKVRLVCDGTIILTDSIGIGRNASVDASGHRVTISGNNAVSPFVVAAGVDFSMTNLTIAHGFSSILGGGVRNFGTLSVMNCTFASNAVVSPTASNGSGGAIHNQGILRVSGSSFLYNRASYSGGAIASGFTFTAPGPVFMTNCTFVGNISSGATISGGSTGPSFVVHCTLSGNTGLGISGGYTLLNSILANNSVANCGGVGLDGGYNLSSDSSCGFTHPASLNNTDPKLGPLADHGGPTLTVSLLDGSPATGAANAIGCPATDQRGIARPYGIGCDIGAFETTLIGTNPGTFRLSASTESLSESQPELIVTVTRADGAFGTASVNFATSDVTAGAGADYAATNGTLVFASGEIQKSFVVRLLNDSIQEADESLTVTLSTPTGGAALGDPHSSLITIIDDETPAVVTVCDDASLRAALGARPTVILACDGTILLTNTILVSKSVSIDGTGHNVAISGGGARRLFVVPPGITLALQNLSLVDGFAVGTNGNTGQPGGAGEGGAIYNDGGTVLAKGCAFLRNRAQGGTGGARSGNNFGSGPGGPAKGGMLYSINGLFASTNCTFLLNGALGGTYGAGFFTETTAGGTAAGGVLFNVGGAIHLSHCSALSNSAVAGVGRRFGGHGVLNAAQGGAIYNFGGDIALSGVELAWNSSTAPYFSGANGGAISHGAGTLSIHSAHIHVNHVEGGVGPGIGSPSGNPGGPAFGGALYVVAGVMQLFDSTLANNIAVGGQAFSSYHAGGAGLGGGLFNGRDAASEVTNSTFNGNEARAGSGGFQMGNGSGGAICNYEGVVALSHVTLAENSASGLKSMSLPAELGGGIFSSNGTFTLKNSIVANSPSGSNCFGTVIDGGHNISSDASCNFTAPGSLNETDPLLGPLFGYGGPTPTMALLAGSPAIDSANSAFCPATDQRGISRPFGAGCDIGAFESSPPYTILGEIRGYRGAPGDIQVRASTSSSFLDATGGYALHGLSAGSYVVTPSYAEAVFVLSNRVINLGPDAVGVDFHSYRSNALFIERITNNSLRTTFAGEAGQTLRVEVSEDFSAWSPFSTNTVESSGVFRFHETNSLSWQPRLFRVVKP